MTMKSKHIFAGGALTGMIALTTSAFAGPLGVISGTGMGAVGIGGSAGGLLSAPLGAAALDNSSAGFGAAGSAAANAANMGSIGAAADGHFAGDTAGAVSANPDALKSVAKGTLSTGARVTGSAEERVQAAHDAAFSEADSAHAAALSARQSARGTVNAGAGTGVKAATGAVAKGREAGAALHNSADDSVEGGIATATSVRTVANAASSRLIHKAGNVSGSAHGGVSASGGAQASGGSDDSVSADGSANAQLRANASAQ
jgi:hypothetical protein